MNQSLLLIIGLVIGLYGGLTISSLIKPNQKFSTEPSFSTLESMYEQYMDDLIEKQEEIRQELALLESRYKQVKQYQKQSNNAVVESSKSQKVIRLLNQGRDLTEIARELGIGIGEVEMILQLTNNKNMH